MKLSTTTRTDIVGLFVYSVLSYACFIHYSILIFWLSIGVTICQALIVFHDLSRDWKDSPIIQQKFIFTCPLCKHRFVPSLFAWLFVPHIGSKRYFKCKECKKYLWMKRK